MPQIAVMNESTVAPDERIISMIPALSKQWNVDLATAWTVEPATFNFIPAGTNPPPLSWWLVFLNDTDQADALAYHELSNDGQPISKVFVRSILDSNHSLSVAASHEICEMAVDPNLQTSFQDEQGNWWAAEVCDAVQEDEYGYVIDGILVSDFVTPLWFDKPFAPGYFDMQRHVANAFQILSQGYGQEWDGVAKKWNQVNGAALGAFKSAKPLKGSRRSRRQLKRAGWRNTELKR